MANEPEYRPPAHVGGGFVAGTLVHTDRGLVRIEKIRVGDMVLSQPEETGELTHKRVLRTVSFEDKEVGFIEYTRYGDAKEDHAAKMRAVAEGDFQTSDVEKSGHLVATKNHLFFGPTGISLSS